ncbi:hypothetical protein J3R83DRAFT_143 [Lanmaoa asiatica]|nr:hypothetical protein J3R83DRAFT_143 [Lanmaoa asiatica]
MSGYATIRAYRKVGVTPEIDYDCHANVKLHRIAPCILPAEKGLGDFQSTLKSTTQHLRHDGFYEDPCHPRDSPSESRVVPSDGLPSGAHQSQQEHFPSPVHYLFHDPPKVADLSKGRYVFLSRLHKLQLYCFAVQERVVLFEGMPKERLVCHSQKNGVVSASSLLVRSRHKTCCTQAERPKGIKKLVGTLVANITLVTMLQTCAALDLDLHSDKRKEIGFKFPFMIRVDIAVEPSDVLSFVKLFLTDDPIPEKMEGMIQVNRFHSHIPGRSGYAPLTKMRDTLWRGEREKANSNPAHRNNPLGLLEFVNNDSDFSITIPLPIYTGPMKLAREKQPFVMFSGLTGASFEKPMTVTSCME